MDLTKIKWSDHTADTGEVLCIHEIHEEFYLSTVTIEAW